MPKRYSHSKLSTFEQCPLKFKFRYIDRIIPPFEKTVEAHLGNAVHETLEWLYEQVLKKTTPSLDSLIVQYAETWQREFTEEIQITKQELTYEDYFNKGVQLLVDYYTKYKPFDDNTLEIEKEINLILGENGEYEIKGFIDRLAHNLKTEEYEIHDYKTANTLPTQEKVDADRQLALYSIAIKELFGMDKKVCLVWHYLAHNTKICSRRTNDELLKLRKEILELIKKIESAKEFLPSKSPLCNWCEYKSMCSCF